MINDLYNKTAYFLEQNITKNEIGGQVVTLSDVANCTCYIATISLTKNPIAGKDNVTIIRELSCDVAIRNSINTSMICRVENQDYVILSIEPTFRDHHLIVMLQQITSPQN
jgi:hypothetical protein